MNQSAFVLEKNRLDHLHPNHFLLSDLLPTPPQSVSVLVVYKNPGYFLVVSWKPPKDNPGAVTGYKVSYKKFRDAKFRTVSIVKKVFLSCCILCILQWKKKKRFWNAFVVGVCTAFKHLGQWKKCIFGQGLGKYWNFMMVNSKLVYFDCVCVFLPLVNMRLSNLTLCVFSDRTAECHRLPVFLACRSQRILHCLCCSSGQPWLQSTHWTHHWSYCRK